MTEAGSWWLRHDDIAAVARYMADNGASADEVASMVEKPWKYTDQWDAMTDDADSVPGWNGAGASVEAQRG